MNVYLSYVHNSENEEYKEKVAEIKAKLGRQFNVLESDAIDDEDILSHYRKRSKLDESTQKNSTEMQLEISFCIVCCINDEYIDEEIMLKLLAITKFNLNIPKIKIIVDDSFDVDSFHHLHFNGDVDRLFEPTDMDEIMSIIFTKAYINAAEDGDLTNITNLVSKGADLNKGDTLDGCTPIHHAASNGHLKTVEYLLENGANINLLDAQNMNCLHKAIIHGCTDIVEYLCRKGIQVNEKCKKEEFSLKTQSNSGDMALHLAIKNNDPDTALDIAQCLVDNGADINATNNKGQTPLHLGVFSKEMVEYLLLKGSKINEKCLRGRTPLHYAISETQDLEVIEYLCDKGASLTEKDKNDQTPIDFAMTSNDPEIFIYFYNNKPSLFRHRKYTVLDRAISLGSVETIKLLYRSGLDIHHKDDLGYTALHKAAKCSKNEIEKVVRYLCRENINVNEKNDQGKTALDLAFEKGTLKAFKYLFTKQLLDHDYSVTFFVDDIRQNYLKNLDDEDEVENENLKPKLNFMHEILDWFESYTIKLENKYINKGIYYDTFESQLLCNRDPNEPHLKMCSIKLKCQHNECLKCLIKMLLNTDNMVNCGTCYDCHEIKIDQISKIYKLICTIWSSKNASTFDIGGKSLKLLQNGIESIGQSKEKMNDDLIRSYMDLIEYYEDCLDVRVESLKIEIDNLKEKMIETVNETKENLKRPGANTPLQLMYRFEELRYRKSDKMIHMSNFGIIKLNAAFITTGNKIHQIAQTIEKNLYNQLVKKKTISKPTTREINFTIAEFNDAKESNKVALKVKMLKYAEGYMIPQMNEAPNISSRTINETLEHIFDWFKYKGNSFIDIDSDDDSSGSDCSSLDEDDPMYSDIESTQSSIVEDEEIMMDDDDDDDMFESDGDSEESSDSDDSHFMRRFSKNQVFTKPVEKDEDVEDLKDLNKILTKIDNNATNLAEMFHMIDDFRSTKSILTEDEIKAFRLVRIGNLDEFKAFMEQTKVRLEAKHNGNTLLFEAIQYEMLDFVEYLLEKGANFNYIDKYGRNALHKAALENKKDDIIELLMKKGCPFLSDQLKFVLLNKTDDSIKRKADTCGCTMFHYIGARGKDDLLDEHKLPNIKDAFLFVKDKAHMSCLDRAAANGHINVINKLTSNRESYKSEVEQMLFRSLEKSDNISDIEVLFSKMEGMKIYIQEFLFNVGGYNSDVIIKKIEFLLSKNAILNFSYYDNYNILMHLMSSVNCKYVDETLFSYLLSKGLDLTHQNIETKTVAHIAAKYGYLDILDILIVCDGVPLNEPDRFGLTPLSYAVRYGHLDIVKWYFERFDQKELLKYNNNIFDMAFSYGFFEICKALKSYGIESSFKNNLNLNMEIKHKKRETEIHACYLRRFSDEIFITINFESFIIRCIKYVKLETILEYGIKIEKYSDNFGANTLHVAALFGRNDIILWLHAKKFPLYSIDKLGFTALAYAAFNRQIQTTLLLKTLGLNDIYLDSKPLLNCYLTCSVNLKDPNNDMINVLCGSIRGTLEKAGKITNKKSEENDLQIVKSICEKMCRFLK